MADFEVGDIVTIVAGWVQGFGSKESPATTTSEYHFIAPGTVCRVTEVLTRKGYDEFRVEPTENIADAWVDGDAMGANTVMADHIRLLPTPKSTSLADVEAFLEDQ